MTLFFYFLVMAATFIAMEGFTWLTHRFVMHGFLWYLHKDHHQTEPGFFEKNDLFFVIFAVPSVLLILLGTFQNTWWMQSMGFGIMAYGIAYFFVHDVIIHQRFKWFSKTNSMYVKAIRRAHKMHHKHLGKLQGESFGMLLVHKKYWETVRKENLTPKKAVYESKQ